MDHSIEVSPEGKVTLPEDIRQMAGIRPGQRLVAVAVGKTITLVPGESADALRGIARGPDPTGYRDRGADR